MFYMSLFWTSQKDAGVRDREKKNKTGICGCGSPSSNLLLPSTVYIYLSVSAFISLLSVCHVYAHDTYVLSYWSYYLVTVN